MQDAARFEIFELVVGIDAAAGGERERTPVVLLDRHVAYLNRLAIDIRLKHGKAISRATGVRSFNGS